MQTARSTNRKRRHLGKDLDLNILPNFKHEMQHKDDMMYVAPSQMRARWVVQACYCLEMDACLNLVKIHEVGRESLVAIMGLSDSTNSK